MINRIALGTAQFGLRYGVANRTGQVEREEIAAILAIASAAGVNTLDTAIAYGESERRLGECGVAKWQVVSKLPAWSAECADMASWVRASVEGSLRRLGVSRLHALLLHRPEQLHGAEGPALHRALTALEADGLIGKFGISIYDPRELDALWPWFKPGIVQAPFNVLDRRLATSGWLARLKQSGVEVHVRSIFLQGLLLMEQAARPAAFARWQNLWDEWQRLLDEQETTAVQACVGFALGFHEVDRVVVGIDSVSHLREILASSTAGRLEIPESMMSNDMDLINPATWKLQ